MNNRTLVVVDIQREYTTAGRPFYLEQAGPSLKTARGVLDAARREGWSIVHVRHLQDGDLFNKTSPHSDYVEEFRPLPGEVEVQKSDFSCYSSPEFARLASERKDGEMVVIGYGSTMCCLSTIIDGYHRKQRLTFVRDASAAKRTGSLGELEAHRAATDIISIYAKVVAAKDLLETPAAIPA